MKRLLKKVICSFIPTKNNRITIIDETSFSGSNSYALYKYIMSNEKDNVLNNLEIRIFDKSSKSRKEKINGFLYKVSSKVIITTHSIARYKKNQKLIQLWHGIPLKAMGLMDKDYCREWVKSIKSVFDDLDAIMSTSDFYSTLLNSTIGQEAYKYKVLGYPRNDFLVDKNQKNNLLSELFEINDKNRTIFFIPTFKMGYADRVEGSTKDNNYFGFEKCSLEKFSQFLTKNNLNFILKLHPFEESYYKEKLKNLNLKNIFFLSSDMLINKKKDLYEYLGQSDMLITDYSSVYFDYLITDKPMLFINVDEEEYRQTRGFILEPYKFWTPGPKVQDQDMLEKEILNCLNNKDYYAAERKSMTELFLKNTDGSSSKRVWNYIKDEYLQVKE